MKKFWMKAYVYDRNAAKLEEEKFISINPNFKGKRACKERPAKKLKPDEAIKEEVNKKEILS
ncbi:hypothetical protein A2U01_0115425 [Trifolium medium]|uniref:Uncharacterized protein n=1 Tax=Trifolium medium TaxID=97028 RepID=A0A392W1H1_9FABA|nr:hypothetical protein [Trifolium medium]